jgi:O-antigen/teichoic acid export membrane protein
MRSEVASRLFKGAFANGFSQIVTVIVQLTSVPLLLSCWGVGLYGEWLVLSAIPVYLSMSDFGFGAGVANEMTILVAKGNRRSALKTFQSVLVLMIIVSATLAMVLVLVSEYLPWEEWFQFSKLGHSDIVYVILLLGFHILFGLQLSLLEAGFRCDGNYAKGTLFLALLRLIEYLVMFIAVILGGGPVAAALSFLIVRVIGIVGLRLLLRRFCPWITYGYSHASVTTVKRLASPAISFMAFPLGNALSMQGMIMAIGAVLGPVPVVIFSVVRTVSRIALQGMGLINSSVWPELSIAFGKGDLELVRRLHRLSCQLSFWLSNVLIVILLIIGEALIRIWTHGKVEVDYEFFALMMAVISANSFWYTSSVVHAAINKHQRMAGLYLLGTGTSLFLATWLLPIWGLNGAAIALLSVDCLMVLHVVKKSVLLSEDTLPAFLRNIASPQLRLRNFIFK